MPRGFALVLSILLGVPLGLAPFSTASQQVVDLDLFEGRTDIGKIKIPGAAKFDAEKKELRLTGSGTNIWDKEDAFHFAWRKASGDLILSADIGFEGKGKNAHRKAGWMIRQGLDADAPYAGVSVHGDGLITLHYRKVKGGPTVDVKAVVKAPATVQLERHGDVISLSAGKPGQELQPVGA